MALKLLLTACLAACVLAAPAPAPDSPEPPTESFASGLSVLYNTFSQCERADDALGCLKLKAIRSLERAIKADRVELLDGLSLARTPVAEGARSQSEDLAELEESALPEDEGARQEMLDELVTDRARRLMESHSVSFSVPRFLQQDVEEEDSGLVETGRKKQGLGGGGGGGGKKGNHLLMLGMLWKAWMTVMAYKGVALLAGKALLTATVAAVLAGVLALSKLHGHEKSHTTVEIVRHPHVTHSYSHSASHEHVDDGGHGWGRSFEEQQRLAAEAQTRAHSETGGVMAGDALAYRGYVPAPRPQGQAYNVPL